MASGETNYIQYERIGLILVPGFMQIENKQKLKGIIFILLFVGFSLISIITMNTSYAFFLLVYVWGFSILDSLSIVNELKEKRTSRTVGALDLIDKPDDPTFKQKRSDSFEKGDQFENFVQNKFNRREFTLVKRSVPVSRADGYLVDGLRIESNLDPDIIIRYRPNLEKFAIETKYRSSLSNYNLVYPDQMARYKQFEEEEKIPVYIVIGLGGDAKKPNQVFILPLKAASSHELSLDFLSKFEVDPNRDFKWQPGSVLNSGRLYQSK